MSETETGLSQLIDDIEFARFDSRFRLFNIFEAIGAVRGELRHSNFLAFLMTPHAAHGLGSELLQRILRGIIERCPVNLRPISSLKVAVGDLDGADVRREQDNIDVLVEIRDLNLVVAIENKVGAKAGDGQLARYGEIVRSKFPHHQRLLVFLTPERHEPDEEGWIAYGYAELAAVIDAFRRSRAPPPSEEIAIVLKHYVDMLRRHIVEDEELKQLAIQIYQKHRDALEFIYSCHSEGNESLLEEIRPILESQSNVVIDRNSPTVLRFVPAEWIAIPQLNACPPQLWTKTGRNLIFEIKSLKTDESGSRDKIQLSLILGASDEGLRQYLFRRMQSDPKTFSGIGKTMGQLWAMVFKRELLSRNSAMRMDDDEKRNAVRESFEGFLKAEFVSVTGAVVKICSEVPEKL